MANNVLTKEDAIARVDELKALPFIHEGNSAFSFSTSVSWHPRWQIIFDLCTSVQSEHDQLLKIRDQIQEAVRAGKAYTFCDFGGGWEWYPEVVDVAGKRIRVFSNGGACIYKGQHDRPVITL